MNHIYHALVLNLHQPTGNLEFLLENKNWEAKEILWAIDRIPRMLWEYEDIARVHLSLSGTLLETLADPDFQKRVYGIVKCGDLLWYLQNSRIFELLATGYYHPVFPLIPEADREEQIIRWMSLGRHLFARKKFPGFWPPEMGFSMEMIPLLKKMGFEYVIVDSLHVEPKTSMKWEELRYQPHYAEFNGERIIVIVRDRDLSHAQESGMDFGWFKNELHERTKWCDFEPLVTTCTDGDNGGWFRNTTFKSNFWGGLHRQFMEEVRHGSTALKPIFIHDYIKEFGVKGYVTVNKGAWNTGEHSGIGFVQWTGSKRQKEVLSRVKTTSDSFHQLREKSRGLHSADTDLQNMLIEAQTHLLRAETSCFLFWGESWVDRCHTELDSAWKIINEVEPVAKT